MPMRTVSILRAALGVSADLATLGMASPATVYTAAGYICPTITCSSLSAQMWMSVWRVLMNVSTTLTVKTLWEATPVSVLLGSLEMDLSATDVSHSKVYTRQLPIVTRNIHPKMSVMHSFLFRMSYK